jgi:hypothetical protein
MAVFTNVLTRSAGTATLCSRPLEQERNMTLTTGSTNRKRSRALGLFVMAAAFMAPLAANAYDHHPVPPHRPVHHRHQVCKPVRVYDHHHHYHTERRCHWVN